MRLPQDKKERIKILVIALMVLVAALNGTFMFVIKPMRAKQKAATERIIELDNQLRTARAQIARVLAEREINIGVIRDIIEITDVKGYVLRARLGNFLLSATEAMEECAKRIDVPLAAVREVGVSSVPKAPEAPGDNYFNSYNVRVNLECGLHDLVRLLREIETSSPYLCVSNLGIVSQSGTPGVHDASFDVQWPIWVDANAADGLRRQLEEAEGLTAAPETGGQTAGPES